MGRAGVLLRARLAGMRAEELPIAPLLMHALIASVQVWLARGALAPYAYGVYGLSLVAILVALPLLGEFGHLLRADPAEEWVAALPATRRDLRLARALHVALALAWLAAGSLLPVVVGAPSVGLLQRLFLVAGGLGLVATLAALLLALHGLLGERAEPLLVLLQTLLFVAAVVGFVLGTAVFPLLADVAGLGGAAWTWIFPPAWFAAPLAGLGAANLAAPLALAAGSLFLFLALPAAPTRRAARRQPLLALLLAPVRALATRLWVRRAERGAFDLVYDALPLEREVVLRTYPLIGVPIAFVVAGNAGAAAGTASDLFAVLFFTACIYLPVILTHVPASESHAARWILETHPLPPGALEGGVIKAIALRFVFPLYLVLAALAWALAGPGIVLRMALPGFLVSLLVLRALYAGSVQGLPLSVAPDAVEAKFDWSGSIVAYGILLTIAAVLWNRFLPNPLLGLGLAALLLFVELAVERRQRGAPRGTSAQRR